MQDDILDQASSWLASGHGVALATVVSTWGSSPRPVGSQARRAAAKYCVARATDRRPKLRALGGE